MKKVYQLLMTIENDFDCNLLYSSKKKAIIDMNYYLEKGVNDKKITKAEIIDRILF